jgi:choloylglycine hydrolase
MWSANQQLLFARTMDWHEFEHQALYVPRAYAWQSVYDQQAHQNQYAILGVGRPDRYAHVDISDGINEHGLAVQKLTYSNKSEYQLKPDATKTNLAPFELVLWLLGNYRSVVDVVAHLTEIQLMADEIAAVQYGRMDLHFALTDETGRMINLEPVNGELQVVENFVGVVTNAPNFDREVNKLADYLDVADLEALPVNKISTGNFNGKKVFPGSYTPSNRFIRATVLKERAVLPVDEADDVVEVWHILNSVTVPKSIDRSTTYTVYRSAVGVHSRTLYYQPYADFSLRQFQFDAKLLGMNELVVLG